MNIFKIIPNKRDNQTFYFIQVDDQDTCIYGLTFKSTMSFLKKFKQDIVEYMDWKSNDANGNLSFNFFLNGYSGPAQSSFRESYPEMGL